MFATPLDKMGAASRALPHDGVTRDVPRASSSDSTNTVITVDVSQTMESSSSTPPTSVGDSISVTSASLKLEDGIPHPSENPNGRGRRARESVETYNVKIMSGTAIHTRTKYASKAAGTDRETRRRTISGDTLVGVLASANSSTETVQKDVNRLVRDGIDALDLQWSMKGLPKSKSQIGLGNSPKKSAKQDLSRRKSTRLAGEKVESLTKKLSVLGKRGRKTFEDGLAKAKRELRNLADTNEYAGIETKPVLLEVWSNGKLVTEEPPKKKKKVEELDTGKKTPEEVQPEEKKKPVGRRDKVWLSKGLYAGQEAKKLGLSSVSEKEAKTSSPKFNLPGILPTPMWQGERLLRFGRDFKLPFDVCSPLPPGQPKPDEWRKTSSNRFVGDAAAAWKKSSLFDSFSSKCVCSPERGCDEDCQNRIMLYECDDTNCSPGRELCTNRSFADLQERRKSGGKYRIGVEVIKTSDRGYGVRTNRCFDAHQIIVEYTGEIITEEECDRRMNEDYKDNDCYYLMSFDQNMIIDATKGSIARFVNHSCNPNCRMVKWIVGGKPRMALFTGDGPIMTGEELTYDYNFDPFSAKNVQECRCGSANCRGILGPRPKDHKVVKESIKEAVKAGVKAGKRKLKELFGGEEKGNGKGSRSPKKRKISVAKGAKRSTPSKRDSKGSPKTIKKTVTAQLRKAHLAVSSKKGGSIAVKKTKAVRVVKYGKTQNKLSSRNSSLTIVTPGKSPRAKKLSTKSNSLGKKSVTKSAVKAMRVAGRVTLSPGERGSTIRVIAAAEDD